MDRFCQHRRIGALVKLCATVLVFSVACFLISLMYINQQYNLSGYRSVPDFLPALFHNNNQVARTGYHRLYDIPPQHNVSAVQDATQIQTIHSILYFNMPVYDRIERLMKQFESCPYNNCRYTDIKGNLKTHSAILFDFVETLPSSPPIPVAERSRDQAWIFFGMEPPRYNNELQYRHADWRNTMNWSMTYRLDADIFMPYGTLQSRRVLPNKNYAEIYHSKTKFAVWFVSRCGADSGRDEYANELKRYGIPVDIVGHCAVDHTRRYSIDKRKALIDREYKFYFSFENSLCQDYITEKVFDIYNLNTVLVVRGGANYSKLLPKGVVIDAASFQTVKDLAEYLLQVNSSVKEYSGYLRRKDMYIATGGFGGHCKLCEKVNNIEANRKQYDDMVAYLQSGMCVNSNYGFVYKTMAVVDGTSCLGVVFVIVIVFVFLLLMRLRISAKVHALY